jgi:O-antigen/teichoic acid export membrane protein/GT2 family glycosyltransferase
MSGHTVSIVICVYTLDRWNDICEAIASARAQELAPIEIVVVVDHNVELRDRLKEAFSDILIVENQFTRGLSGARNTGISIAKGDIVAFLDDDAVADPAWLKMMAPHFDATNVIGVGSRSAPMWLGERPSWFPDEFLWVVGCSYRGMSEVTSTVRNCLGGAMCFRRALFEKVSGFNPSLGRGQRALLLSGEETELCLRATDQIEGAIFIYEPASFISHKVSPNRLNWKYFVRRCYAEGISKAYLAKLRPSPEALAPERHHAMNVLPKGIMQGVRDAFYGRDFGGLGRAAAIIVGLASAVAGYAIGNAHMMGRGRSGPVDVPQDDMVVAGSETLVALKTSATNSVALRRTLDKINERFGMHSEMLSNAGAIALGTFGAAALGFVYWWVAARNFTPEAVGLAAAAISTMTLIGMIGELGLGTLLMGESLLNRRDAPGLIAASLITAILLSLVLGAAFVLIAPLFISNFNEEFSSFDEGALFIVGCAIMSFAMVLDQALIGWLRATQQMGRNMLFSVLKLVLLVVVASLGIAGIASHEVVILATWVFGQLAATLLFAIWLLGRGQPIWHKPEFGQLQGRVGKVLGHHFLNTVTQGPGFILPGLVTFVLSAQINAAFYASYTLINVACYVPAALATVLFTVGSTDPGSLSERLRMSLRLSAAVGIAAALGFYLLSDFILGLFNPAYPAIAGSSLQLMGAVVLPIAVKYHFITIQRLTNNMMRGAVVLGIAGAFEIAMAYLGAEWHGLWGFTLAWIVANYIEAGLMLPVILRHLAPGPSLEVRESSAV